MRASSNRLVAIIAGAGFVLAGAAGFFVGPDALLLGVFEVNTLHNIVHLVLGAALLISGLSGVRVAKTMNAVVGTLCLLLGLFGLFVVGTGVNILALNGADNVLHFGSAVLLLAIGIGAERTARSA